MTYKAQIQMIAGNWKDLQAFATYRNGAWVVPSYQTREDARRAAKVAFPTLPDECIRAAYADDHDWANEAKAHGIGDSL